MDEEIFSWLGVFALPISIIALLLIFTVTEYTFNENQFVINDSNVSINESWIISTLNNSNITINANVNHSATSDYANNSGQLQGRDTPTLVSYIQGLFDSVYCLLTGCTMAGDINMNGNDILNVDNINASYFLGNGSTLSGVCLSNGTNCIAQSSNPFNQVLNTTSNVTFNEVNINKLITSYIEPVSGENFNLIAAGSEELYFEGSKITMNSPADALTYSGYDISFNAQNDVIFNSDYTITFNPSSQTTISLNNNANLFLGDPHYTFNGETITISGTDASITQEDPAGSGATNTFFGSTFGSAGGTVTLGTNGNIIQNNVPDANNFVSEAGHWFGSSGYYPMWIGEQGQIYQSYEQDTVNRFYASSFSEQSDGSSYVLLGTDGTITQVGTQSGNTLSKTKITELNTTNLFLAPKVISTCNSANAGAIYYNITLNKHYGCNSTTWNALY